MTTLSDSKNWETQVCKVVYTISKSVINSQEKTGWKRGEENPQISVRIINRPTTKRPLSEKRKKNSKCTHQSDIIHQNTEKKIS